jgi:zinc/manganese transport system permease protein
MDTLLFLLPAFALTTFLILTHTYLGLHVLARGIIFVDIALAQIAALGASVAFLMGETVHGVSGQIFSFSFTLAAAFGFTQLRRINVKTTREVTIGCIYVVTTALSIVVLSRSVAGMEELKTLFNGSILWARWQDVGILGLVSILVGILFLFGHERFKQLSMESEKSISGTYAWECIFFASFAIVITTAVHLAGILVVFAFLIIPAFSASILVQSWRMRLLLGWTFGLSGSLVGLLLAYFADLPIGATVVSVLGIVPILSAVFRYRTSLLR